MTLRVKVVASLILAIVSSAFGRESDPCKLDREAWQADKFNTTKLERWNKCLEPFEAEKARIEAEREKAIEAQEAAEEKALAAEEAEAAVRARRPGARIGMSASQVINRTRWGRPNAINKTITAHGVREQWVYSDGMYLYFVNGRLTAIQTTD